jgi:pimeloyl-ACP methyl ester carboxylesterase
MLVERDHGMLFYTVVGTGPPMTLLHPAGLSGASWEDIGFVDAFYEQRQMVLIDAMGSGQSTKPAVPAAYTDEVKVADVLAVLDALDIESADVLGYSMGGVTAFQVAALAPQRVRSFVAGGAPPPGMQPSAPPGYQPRTPPPDPAVNAARREAMRAFRDLTPRLPGLRMPALLYAGTEDPFHDFVREAASLMPDARFESIPGATHGSAFEDMTIWPAIRRFLTGATRGE